MSFNIDPAEGAEAAAELPDDDFRVLLQIVMWELAIRTSAEHFEDHLKEMVEARSRIEGDIVASRRARDQRRFVTSVLGDIERLPSTEASSTELTTGLYL
jgi:hypothetical protein